MGKRIHIVFDVQHDRSRARTFLTEMAEQGLGAEVVGVSQADTFSEAQRGLVLTEQMRKADLVVVLISGATALSKTVAEELKHAEGAGTPVIGVLVGGVTTKSAMPKGIDRKRVYGWDWGTLKRLFR